MLTATGKNGRVNAWETSKGDGPFECPGCHWPAILKSGIFKVAHFAHEPGADCPYASYHQGESALHLGAKKEVFTALSTCEGVTDLKLERYLGPVRPDISFRLNGVPVAVEMQVSQIDVHTIARRTKEYSRRGIYLLWVSPWSEVEGLEHDHYYSNSHGWERYVHYVLYHGRFYYWLNGATVRPVHFDESQTGYTSDPLLIIKQAMLTARIQPDCHITSLAPFALSVQYSEVQPIPREAKLWGIPSIWVGRDNRFMPVHEACKRYPSEFFDPSQLILPADVKPFEGDPFDDTAPFDPSEFLDIPPGMPEKCSVHNRLFHYSDRFGNFYCTHPACWSRYRLLLLGQELEYPEIIAVYDPRDYLPDLSADPYYKPSPREDSPVIPIYPALPPVTRLLLNAGEDVWREFASLQGYSQIALALKSLDKHLRSQEEEDA